MSFVLMITDTVHCAQGGTVQTVGAPKLTIGGNPVLLLAGVSKRLITGCVPPPNSTPCSTVGTATGGAKKLTVGNKPVALKDLASLTDGKVGGVIQALLPTAPSQSKLNAEPL
jgi:hypothetical protein